MRILLYFFIGNVSALVNIGTFATHTWYGNEYGNQCRMVYVAAVAVNYLLCIAILFRHRARCQLMGELAAYAGITLIMVALDYAIIYALMACAITPIWSKMWALMWGLWVTSYCKKFSISRKYIR